VTGYVIPSYSVALDVTAMTAVAVATFVPSPLFSEETSFSEGIADCTHDRLIAQ